MGNIGSKVTRNGRVLAKKAHKFVVEPTAKTTRPDVIHRKLDEGGRSEGEHALSDRLKKIGQVQYKPAEEHFKPASEDKLTLTLEARQRLENKSALELEQSGSRKLLPPTTIHAILRSLKEGDSFDRVTKAFSLDASVFPKLQYLSVPDTQLHESLSAPNQVLDSNQPTNRNPVRRSRKETS